jgi:hypothetical protein
VVALPLAAAVLDAGELPLSSEQPTSMAAAAMRPIPAARTRFREVPIDFPSLKRVAPMASS